MNSDETNDALKKYWDGRRERLEAMDTRQLLVELVLSIDGIAMNGISVY